MLDDIARCKQEKQALEVDLMQLKKERDLLKTRISSTSGTAMNLCGIVLYNFF